MTAETSKKEVTIKSWSKEKVIALLDAELFAATHNFLSASKGEASSCSRSYAETKVAETTLCLFERDLLPYIVMADWKDATAIALVNWLNLVSSIGVDAEKTVEELGPDRMEVLSDLEDFIECCIERTNRINEVEVKGVLSSPLDEFWDEIQEPV